VASEHKAYAAYNHSDRLISLLCLPEKTSALNTHLFVGFDVTPGSEEGVAREWWIVDFPLHPNGDSEVPSDDT